MQHPKSAGFTLLELVFVVCIMSILVSITAPTYAVYRQRALATEATIALESIAHLELVSILETSSTIACAPTPTTIPSKPTRFVSTEAWERLGYQPQGLVRFQYEVEKTGPVHFVARARADLDHDGLVGEYWIDGRDLELKSKHPGE
ncbi:MAG: prepilin-type N-terminal cleavage/methylation domain-containing protein [Deltaproteobacteria bacterium]|nr:prepilin-type N-terminal cleavage/methylation domain-containing protein [Deltaproteobacteria bacterium]